MRFIHILCLFYLSVPLLSSCSPDPVILPTSPSFLPDLVVSNIYLGMQGMPTNRTECIPSYGSFEIRALIQNSGQSDVYNIDVEEISTNTTLTIGELGANQVIELNFPITSPKDSYNVVIDPQNSIPEINENNNTRSYLAITPTPPVLCTQTTTSSLESATPNTKNESGNSTLSQVVLGNSIYRSPDWGEFQLQDGVYYRTPLTSQESPEIYTTRILGPILYGDLNTDEVEDALVILSTQNGGTGHFIELAAVINQNGNAYNIATLSLGDRVFIESGLVENGIVVLNLRVHRPEDGLCCPSQFVTWNFVLSGNQLVKLP